MPTPVKSVQLLRLSSTSTYPRAAKEYKCRPTSTVVSSLRIRSYCLDCPGIKVRSCKAQLFNEGAQVSRSALHTKILAPHCHTSHSTNANPVPFCDRTTDIDRCCPACPLVDSKTVGTIWRKHGDIHCPQLLSLLSYCTLSSCILPAWQLP